MCVLSDAGGQVSIFSKLHDNVQRVALHDAVDKSHNVQVAKACQQLRFMQRLLPLCLAHAIVQEYLFHYHLFTTHTRAT